MLRLEAWARDGLTDEQIAKNCGIHRDTLNSWKKQYPVISDTLKRGKEVVDIQVENALLKRALGYEYEEIMVEDSEDGRKERITTKHVIPDVGAIAFWLKNRKPDVWRDKREAPSAEADGVLTKLIEGLRDG